MRKAYLTILVLVTAIGGALEADEFPPDFFFTWELGEGWTDAIPVEIDSYDLAWRSESTPLTIEMRVTGEILPPEEHLDAFVATFPPADAEVQFYGVEAYDGYLEEYYDVPFVGVTSGGVLYVARADFPDFTGVITIISVPVDQADAYFPVIERIIYP